MSQQVIDRENGEATGGEPAGTPVGRQGARMDIAERTAWSMNGFLALLISFGFLVLAALGVVNAVRSSGTPLGSILGSLVALTVAGFILTSLTVVSPGDTKVLQFFGRYLGTVRKTGLQLVTPLTFKSRVSVKVHNFETNELKVNDADGNPINIAAIVVWQVADTAKAMFAVEKYREFVAVQAESALRHVAMSHPYDNSAEDGVTLRGDTDVVGAELAHEVAERIALAGLEVIEVRISSLAYAPEIAQAMLQRQQASAIIAAREKIVQGAVGMVHSALEKLEQDNIVDLDDERRAAMVSNLLVVLCSERGTSPVVNTGSLYG